MRGIIFCPFLKGLGCTPEELIDCLNIHATLIELGNAKPDNDKRIRIYGAGTCRVSTNGLKWRPVEVLGNVSPQNAMSPHCYAASINTNRPTGRSISTV